MIRIIINIEVLSLCELHIDREITQELLEVIRNSYGVDYIVDRHQGRRYSLEFHRAIAIPFEDVEKNLRYSIIGFFTDKDLKEQSDG